MKYKHTKTGNILFTPFEIRSKTWLPVPEPEESPAAAESTSSAEVSGEKPAAAEKEKASEPGAKATGSAKRKKA